MVHTTERADCGSLDLESWRQRLITFRIDPSQLSYPNKGKVVASGGYGCVRRAILLPQVSKTDGNPEAHGWPTIASETVVAVKSLQAHGDIDLERFEKILDAAEGLYYLHSRDPPICHGDVKGSNLLIKDNGRGALCDFGSAHELDEMFEDIASKTTQRCTVRWASPERLDSNDPPTPSSDVWSWGWLTWEIMTEKVPFPLLTNVSAVIFHIITSKVPSCEKETGFMEFPHLSQLIQRCWQGTPDSRPSIFDAISKLKHILEPNQSGADFIQTGGAPDVEASLSDHTQRQPQSLLDQDNETTPEGASSQSQTSVDVRNISNPAVWTPEVNSKLPKYLPHRGNCPPTPLDGNYSPDLFFPTISPFLSTGHRLEALSDTSDPEVPRPVIVDQQSKARVSPPEPVGGGTNGGPSGTPDLSGHSGPGPSKLVTSKNPEILSESPGSGSPAPRKRSFQSSETGPEVGPILPSRKKRSRTSVRTKSLPEPSNEQLQRAPRRESRQSAPATRPTRGRSVAKNVPASRKSHSDMSGRLEPPPQIQALARARPESSHQLYPVPQALGEWVNPSDLEEQFKEYAAADPTAGYMTPQHNPSVPVTCSSQSLANPPQHQLMQQSVPQQAGGEPGFGHYASQLFISDLGSRSSEIQYSVFQQYSLKYYDNYTEDDAYDDGVAYGDNDMGYGDNDIGYGDDDMGYCANDMEYGDDDMGGTTCRPPISVAEIELIGNFLEDPKSTTGKGIVKATGQLVALKSLPSITARNRQEGTLNTSELGEWLKNCSSLKHPRIAELLGCPLTVDNLTIISVWYPNRSVADFLTVVPRVPRKPMLIQVAEGLTYLHNHVPPIIHSNLKP
ncbi:hypothetical protein FS837_005717, partial [Tulasnella sp. UAMH 9824]